ncbi:MAG TPA: phage holin family protein [Opitutaceae bacterium]
MDTTPPASSGLLGSLRTLGADAIAAVKDRLALFSLELQEEKYRLIQVVIWISAAAFAGTMAIMFASITLVYFFWESARLAVLGGLTLFYTAALVVILIAFRRYLARQPRPFDGVLEELTEDEKCIRGKN